MNEYRQNAINHLKTHLGCVGYRDYLVAELEKLDKIENIVDAYTTDNPKEPMYDTEDYMNSIREVLEQE